MGEGQLFSNELLSFVDWRLIRLILGLFILWFLIRVIRKFFILNVKDNEHRYTLNKLNSSIGYVLGFILIMLSYSDQMQHVGIALGVAGAGIAFALQEVIVSLAGWLAIMIGGFFRTGDRVQMGGVRGDVMDIGILRTTIMETGQWIDGDLYSGRMVFVVNSFVFKEPVYNYSGEFPFLWDEIKVPIKYGSDYVLAKELILNIGIKIAGDLTESSREKWNSLQDKYHLEFAQTSPLVSIRANDNWVEYTLRFVVDYRKRRSTKTDLFMAILKAVEETQGKVGFASATIQLVDTPDFNLHLSKEDDVVVKT